LSAAFILRDCSENSRELLFARSGGDYLTAGRPAIAVVSDENWSLVVYLPERHLQRLKVGQKVYCYIGSDPWKIHLGKDSQYRSGRFRSVDPSRFLPYVDLPPTGFDRLAGFRLRSTWATYRRNSNYLSAAMRTQDRPMRELLEDIFSDLVFTQHMRVAHARFDVYAAPTLSFG
jgi:hypothetical protein